MDKDKWSSGSGIAKATPLGHYQGIIVAGVLAAAILGAALIVRSGGATPPPRPEAAPAGLVTGGLAPAAGLTECQNAAEAVHNLWGEALNTGSADTSSVNGLVSECYGFQGSSDHQVQACQDAVDISLEGTQLSTEAALYFSNGLYTEAQIKRDQAGQLLRDVDRPWRECWA
jgi:hypothetical protein